MVDLKMFVVRKMSLGWDHVQPSYLTILGRQDLWLLGEQSFRFVRTHGNARLNRKKISQLCISKLRADILGNDRTSLEKIDINVAYERRYTCDVLEIIVITRYVPVSGLQTLDAQRVDIDARRVQKPPRERIENRDSVLPRNFHWFQFANHVTKQYHSVSATWFVVRRLRTERHSPWLFSILSNYFKHESSNFATVVHALVRLRDVDHDFVMTSCKFIRLLTILGRPLISFLRITSQ